ncbi:MAG: glycosyltransferase [Muribaculaceae bacterium]|nr:glycosyltransferase [Muribaculaceae bacterium]
MSKFFSARIELSRRATVIARGVSILLIMLHNLVHIFPTIINEAEFNYSPALNRYFSLRLDSSNPLLIYDLLSFIGWYGVPVFIFLSGFGLARRYDNDPHFSIGSFIRRNWCKLFFLMLPAVVIFVTESIVHKLWIGQPLDWHQLICEAIPLTELNGLFQYWFPVIPGVYWYMGLTFELYVIYAFAVRRRPAWILWALTAACYISIAVMVTPQHVGQTTDLVWYLRHNFTGWMLPFACGIFIGRKKFFPLVSLIAVFILSLLLFLPALNSPLGWQAAALPAIVIIIGVSVAIDRIPMLNRMVEWVGLLSAVIYIVHPVIRHWLGSIFFDFASPDAVPDAKIITIYVFLVFIGSLIYRPVSQYIEKLSYKLFSGSSSVNNISSECGIYPLVSVIVPVYNASRWLRDALDSLKNQTYRNFEVILVNDGSTDDSEAICRKYVSADDRFRLVTQSNSGVSEARNRGIDLARGEWIAFMDADDIMPPDALEVMIHHALYTNAVIVAGNFCRGIPTSIPKNIGTALVLSSEDAICEGLYQKRRLNNPWGMLFSSSIFRNFPDSSPLRFRNCRYEDLDLFYRAFERAVSIAVIDRVVYFYRDTPGSFINSWSEARLDVLKVTADMESHFAHGNPRLWRAARDRRFSAACNILIELMKYRIYNPEALRYCIDIIRNLRIEELKDRNVRIKNKVGALLSYPALPIIKILFKS